MKKYRHDGIVLVAKVLSRENAETTAKCEAYLCLSRANGGDEFVRESDSNLRPAPLGFHGDESFSV